MENILNAAIQLIRNDFSGVSLAVIATIISGVALYNYRRVHLKKLAVSVYELESRILALKQESANYSENEKIKFDFSISNIEKDLEKFKKDIGYVQPKQKGFITQDFLLYAVPAIIALTFTFTLVYLLISNQSVANYQSPEVLKNGLSIIIGYYFGVAVKEKPSSGNTDSEIMKISKSLEDIISKK